MLSISKKMEYALYYMMTKKSFVFSPAWNSIKKVEDIFEGMTLERVFNKEFRKRKK